MYKAQHSPLPAQSRPLAAFCHSSAQGSCLAGLGSSLLLLPAVAGIHGLTPCALLTQRHLLSAAFGVPSMHVNTQKAGHAMRMSPLTC